MAARQGDSKRLKDLLLLNYAQSAATGHVVVVEVADRRRLVVDGVTIKGDSLLHVVAACGDGDEFLDCAKMICHKASWLLVARNNKGDTPFHCAAGAGNTNMISCLAALAGDEVINKEAFIRTPNQCGETALHHAVRSGSKASMAKLLSLDPELACIPPDNNTAGSDQEGGGASPMYLAISLGDDEMDIAQHLFDTSKGKLSYSGPDGRNVLHEAVSHGPQGAWLASLLRSTLAIY